MNLFTHITGETMIEAKLHTVRVCETPAPDANSPEKCAALWHAHIPQTSWHDEGREQLVVFTLDTRHRCTGFFLISVGSLSETTAHPREILRPVIMSGAYSFVIAHNHPSGDPTPSEADRALTRRIRDAADLFQINLLDHIIIGRPGASAAHSPGHFSFKEHGLL